jgi:hypothetical protein
LNVITDQQLTDVLRSAEAASEAQYTRGYNTLTNAEKKRLWKLASDLTRHVTQLGLNQ